MVLGGASMAHQTHWSRRSLLGAGLAAAPLFAWADPVPPPSEAIATGSSGRNLLTIGVQLDGKGPFQFVVDTGADRSVIADNVAATLGLKGGAPVMVEGVVRTVEARTVRLQSLAAGVVERAGLELPVLPREQLMVDGYLGLDVINGYRLSLDFRQHELRLIQRHSRQTVGWDAPSEVAVRLAGNEGHLYAFDCMIDGVRSNAFIDTGAEISVGKARLHAMLNELNSGYTMQETIPLTGVTGGVVEGRVVTLKHIHLRGLDIEGCRIAIAGLQIFRLWDLEDRPSLLIGMNWLRQFNRVAIDYGNKEVRFDLAAKIRDEGPLRCPPGAPRGDCRYLLGSPNTIPRPSVAT